MAANDRDNPTRQKSSESDLSLIEFMRRYPDDAACLDRLWRKRFAPDGHHAQCPKCDRERKFHRTKARAAYSCDSCGHHIYPMKGTIFEKSTTSLQLWFYAAYLMTSTRCGISAKQLEREIGVHYETAHRMMKKIRTELMKDGDEQLRGDVEIDETSVGGRTKRQHGTHSQIAIGPSRQGKRPSNAKQNPTVLGMVERGGRIRFRVIASRHGAPLSNAVIANVNPGSIIFTDDWRSYRPLSDHFSDHQVVNHSSGEYVRGYAYTNTIEGAFGNMKTGIRGVYKQVSRAYLQSYLDEYAWRSNAKLSDEPLFEQLLEAAL